MEKHLLIAGFHQFGTKYSPSISETAGSSGPAALQQQGLQQHPSIQNHPTATPAKRTQPTQQGNHADHGGHGACWFTVLAVPGALGME
jgi:hypothetical protein